MQTAKQINNVLTRCKGGQHHKDLRWKKEKQRQQEFKQAMVEIK